MSKQGSTKQMIIELINEGNDSLTKISDKLNLAPSTVSKHLHDLEAEGVIQQKENTHLKKWKYYEVIQNSSSTWEPNGGFFINKRPAAIAGAGIAIILVAAFAIFYFTQSTGASTYVPISLTDPPQVPVGTQALYINYSSVSVYSTYHGASEWTPINASGRLDLMSLINVSQVIGDVSLNSNSTAREVRFNISSAEIVVDNVTYPVYLADKQITASLENSGRINSSSGILLDFSPTVTAVFNQNTTEFVMLPSLRALAVENPEPVLRTGSNNYVYQQRVTLPMSYRNLFSTPDTNISITNTFLSTVGNTTSLRLTVDNKGSRNVTVFGISLMSLNGTNPYIMFNGTPSGNFLTGNYTQNASGFGYGIHISGVPPGQYVRTQAIWQGRNSTNVSKSWVSENSNQTVSINADQVYKMGNNHGYGAVRISLPVPTQNITLYGISAGFGQNQRGGIVTFMQMGQPGINFIVNQNGTLSLPFPPTLPNKQQVFVSQQIGPVGYNIPAGSSATFTYTGNLTFANGRLMVKFFNQSNYTILALTNDGPVQANLTTG